MMQRTQASPSTYHCWGSDTTAPAGPSNPPDVLSTPVGLHADSAVAQADLEKVRQALKEKSDRIDAERRRMEASVREYNAAHGIGQRVIPPPVIEELRAAGRDTTREIAIHG